MRMIKWKYFREFSWKCLKLPDNNVFSGDSYIPGVKVIASFPNSDREDARISKERIMELIKDCSLYPGHGNIYE